MTKRKKPQPAEPPTQIRRLLNKYGISLADLKNCMSEEVQFSSRSTLHRLVTGTLSDELSAELRPVAARCLRRFLSTPARGLNKREIDAELTAIFNEGEYQPMSCQRIYLSHAELTHFGLPADPFRAEPQTRDEVYFPPEYREIFDLCIDAAKYRHFTAVLGPVGSSKSTLQDLLRDHITRETSLKIVWPEFYNQANLTPMEIGRSILTSLGVTKVPGRATALANAVTDRLRALTVEGNRVCIVIDNCHELQKPAVRSLKKFLEMSSGGFQRYLGIVLFGWPEFEMTLAGPDFTEIYERLEVVAMPPFRREGDGTHVLDPELAAKLNRGYLEKRFSNLDVNLYDFFDDDAVNYVAQNAETPLQCGNIANRAMRKSKEVYNNTKVIGESLRTVMFFDTPVANQAFRKRA